MTGNQGVSVHLPRVVRPQWRFISQEATSWAEVERRRRCEPTEVGLVSLLPGTGSLSRGPNLMHGCFHSLAQMPGFCLPTRLWDQSAKLRRPPEVAACGLASGCRHSAQTTEGPYTRQAVPGHPSPCCRRVPGATHGERLRCMCGGLDVRRGAAGYTALGSALLLAPARRPPAEPPRSRGGGAASPVPGAGWRRARTLGPELGAPPAGTPAGLPRGEGLDAQQVPSSFPAQSLTCCATWSEST